MTNIELERRYFDWMIELVSDGETDEVRSHRKLLKHLHEVTFTFSIPMDQNRAEDGIELRYRFGYEEGYSDHEIAVFLDTKDCSLLEMLTALAFRCEEHIMDNPDIGNRTGKWFWNMIYNLGLGEMNDSDYDIEHVDYVIQRFLERKYFRNGDGGLFTVNNSKVDMRSIEIWYQLCLYLNDIA